MRLLIATVKHETNSFSPLPTPYEAFGPGGPIMGARVVETFTGTRLPIGAFLDVAREVGAEVVTPIAANAQPSAPVARSAFERIAGTVVESVRASRPDAILLDLHGAMVVEELGDGEGELLTRIRAVAPTTPIGVALDFHANVAPRLVAAADIIAAYQTYPHVDMYETGQRVARLLIDNIGGRTRPVLRHAARPLLPCILKQGTETGPMAQIMAAARTEERNGLLALSVLGGFPLADAADTGVSAIAIADGANGAAKADAALARVLDLAWSLRHELRTPPEPLDETIARAKSLEGGPVLLVDIADNCNSGGTQDDMTVLAEALRQGLDGIMAGPICDPSAVARLWAAGLGAEITLDIGGRFTGSHSKTGPLHLSGRVAHLGDGHVVVKGPVFTGQRIAMGRTAVLDTGRAKVLVSERRAEPVDLEIMRSQGLEPAAARVLIIKSKMQYRPTFGRLARHVLLCHGSGPASLNYTALAYRNVRRPAFPLDPL